MLALARWLCSLMAITLRPADRAQWAAGWRSELAHKASRGLSFGWMLRLCRDIWRDAMWMRRRSKPAPALGLWARPLVPELAAFSAALGVFAAFSLFYPRPAPPPNASRIAVLQRSFATMGAIVPFFGAPVLKRLESSGLFEAVAIYRLIPENPTGVAVSRNLFRVLGLSEPSAFDPGDIVLTHRAWVERFHSDPHLLGRRVRLGKQKGRVTAILPAGFTFLSRRIEFFTPIPPDTRRAGALVLMPVGQTVEAAQARIADKRLRLAPLAKASGWRTPLEFGLGFAAVTFLIGAVCLNRKSKATLVSCSHLGARLALSLTALSLTGWVAAQFLTLELFPVSILHFWLFMMSGIVIALFTVRDQVRRCPVCLSPLEMPAGFGVWGRVVVDSPAIEYACPRGHGLLYVPESGPEPVRWTPLDASWRDLFVNR